MLEHEALTMYVAAYNFWLEWRLNFSGLNLLPINSAEELVASDIVLALLPTAKSFARVFGQQSLADFFGLT